MFSTLRGKVAAGFVVLIVINVLVSAWSIFNFNQLTQTITMMIRQNYLNVIAAQNMLVSLERDNSAQLTMLNGYIDTGYQQFQDNHSNFFTWFNQARKSNASQLGANTLDQISRTYAKYARATDTLKTVLETQGHVAAQNYHYNDIMPLFNQIKEGCFELLDMNHNAMVETDAKANYISNRATLAVIGAALLAFVLGLVATWQFSQYILEPAEKLTDTVRKIGRGYLDVRADINSNDEIGELASEFNKMAGRLKEYEEINIEKLISEKKKSEAIVSTISDPIIVADKYGKIVLMNELAENVFDVTEDASVGRDFNEVVKNRELCKYLSGYLEGKNPINIPPYFELRFDGEDRYFRIKLNSSRDNSGRVMGVILILQDVTQFKELDKMKSEFMARVSHEFRTPLTSINMTFDILKDEHIGHVNKRQRELLIAAKQDAERLTKLVRELLELSRLESGKIQLKEDRVNSKALIDFSVQPVLLQFKDKDVKLISNVDSGIPEFVADFQQLSWVVSNLVTNALRYTESGGRVTIDATADQEDLIVSVRDTGCGIGGEELEKVFDKFVQLQDSPGSVGLGLSIAKEIVEFYGGRIWVDSRLGVGTTFTFSIPIRKRIAPQRKLSA